MTTAAAWRWCLVAGLIAFACSWGFGRIPGLTPCGDTGGLGPIIAWEFARTPADVARLFGVEPCRSTLIAAQRTALWLDALGFIPAYTAFLSLAAWATGHHRRTFVVTLLLLAGVADEVEGAVLFAIGRDLPGTPALLAALPPPVFAKFGLLIFGTMGLGAMLLEQERPLPRLAGAAVFASAVSVLFATRPPAAAMLQGFTYAWTTLLVLAAVAAAWPRLLVSPPRSPASPSG